jgi:kynurenine formamidase
MSQRRIVDLSQPVGPDTPVFPGDGPVRVDVIEMMDQTTMNLSRIELSVHTGTHMDAPFHFFQGGATIDRVPLVRCMGLAALIDLRGIPAGSEIRRDHIESRRDTLRRARMAVLHTGWSKEWGSQRYFRDHPRLSGDAAEFLVDSGVELTGVDMPSVDQAPYPAHKVLLGAGVPIVENLTNLDAIGADLFELIVLPLRLAGRDGSPVRAVAVFSATDSDLLASGARACP